MKSELTLLGANLHSQISIDAVIGPYSTTKKLEKPVQASERVKAFDVNKVLQVACGEQHTLFLTQDALFVCGKNNQGQCGIGKSQPVASLQELVIAPNAYKREQITFVAAGSYHSIAITKEGKVYSFGLNSYGQCGFPAELFNVYVPMRLSAVYVHERRIVSACCGRGSNFFIDDVGNVVVCGFNQSGMLGCGHYSNVFQPIPLVTTFTSPIKKVASGNAHSIVLLENGTVFGAGSNQFYQLSEAAETRNSHFVQFPPSGFSNKRIIDVSAAADHTVFVTEENKVYGCGSNFESQLGISNLYASMTQLNISNPVARVFCGPSCTFFIAPSIEGPANQEASPLAHLVPSPPYSPRRRTVTITGHMIQAAGKNNYSQLGIYERTCDLEVKQISDVELELHSPAFLEWTVTSIATNPAVSIIHWTSRPNLARLTLFGKFPHSLRGDMSLQLQR